MFDLKVTNKDDALLCIKKGWPTRIISLLNDDFPNFGKNHLHLRFDDIDRPLRGYIMPSILHIDTVLDFTANLQDGDRVLVHCHAGISRSTAMAIGILISHGMDCVEAFNLVKEQRSAISPNEFIINDLEMRFKCEGRLYKAIDEYIAKQILALNKW